jgi:hypothetical protein
VQSCSPSCWGQQTCTLTGTCFSCSCFVTCGRMHPSICEFPSLAFYQVNEALDEGALSSGRICAQPGCPASAQPLPPGLVVMHQAANHVATPTRLLRAVIAVAWLVLPGWWVIRLDPSSTHLHISVYRAGFSPPPVLRTGPPHPAFPGLSPRWGQAGKEWAGCLCCWSTISAAWCTWGHRFAAR